MVRRLRGKIDRVGRANKTDKTARCDERNNIERFFQLIYNY